MSHKTRRIKCTVAYDGTHYHGFQIQPNAPSIQEKLEKALSQIHKKSVSITGSGRTDAGVHAMGQVFHFDTHLQLEEGQWVKAINSLINKDIRYYKDEG